MDPVIRRLAFSNLHENIAIEKPESDCAADGRCLKCGMVSNLVLVEAAKPIMRKRRRVLTTWMDKSEGGPRPEDPATQLEKMWKELPLNQKHIYYTQALDRRNKACGFVPFNRTTDRGPQRKVSGSQLREMLQDLETNPTEMIPKCRCILVASFVEPLVNYHVEPSLPQRPGKLKLVVPVPGINPRQSLVHAASTASTSLSAAPGAALSKSAPLASAATGNKRAKKRTSRAKGPETGGSSKTRRVDKTKPDEFQTVRRPMSCLGSVTITLAPILPESNASILSAPAKLEPGLSKPEYVGPQAEVKTDQYAGHGLEVMQFLLPESEVQIIDEKDVEELYYLAMSIVQVVYGLE